MKDLFINLSTREIINSTKYLLTNRGWLSPEGDEYITTNRSIPHNKTTQFIDPFRTVLCQNYFCYYEHYYQTSKGVAMGALISSVTQELFLHYYEQQITKH
jgi:hypothetical protein